MDCRIVWDDQYTKALNIGSGNVSVLISGNCVSLLSLPLLLPLLFCLPRARSRFLDIWFHVILIRRSDEPVNFSDLFSRCFHILREVMVKSQAQADTCRRKKKKEKKNSGRIPESSILSSSVGELWLSLSSKETLSLDYRFQSPPKYCLSTVLLWNPAYLGIFKMTSPPANSSFP